MTHPDAYLFRFFNSFFTTVEFLLESKEVIAGNKEAATSLIPVAAQ